MTGAAPARPATPMNPPLADLDLLLHRCREAADALTAGSAETLFALVPGARLALWRPLDGRPAATVVRTADGAAPPIGRRHWGTTSPISKDATAA